MCKRFPEIFATCLHTSYDSMSKCFGTPQNTVLKASDDEKICPYKDWCRLKTTFVGVVGNPCARSLAPRPICHNKIASSEAVVLKDNRTKVFAPPRIKISFFRKKCQLVQFLSLDCNHGVPEKKGWHLVTWAQ